MSGKKDCKFCEKQGLLWLPLRYSAVCGEASETSGLPALGGHLGKGVTDLALTHGKYAARLLRPGYLYVLLERNGLRYWTAYLVIQDAYLYQFEPEAPPQLTPTFSCERHTCGVNASMVSIPSPQQVPTVWALFTPSPLSKAKLKEYKDSAVAHAAAGKMQTFSPAGWVKGQTGQPHSLQAPELLTQVAEFIVATQANPAQHPLGEALKKQLFPASVDAYVSAKPNDRGEYTGRLGALYNSLHLNGFAALALHDPIGIAQELNDYRNAPMEGIQNYLAAVDSYGASNQHRLQVWDAIEEIKSGIRAGLVIAEHQSFAVHAESVAGRDQSRRESVDILRKKGMAIEAQALEDELNRVEEVREENYRKGLEAAQKEGLAKWEKKYENRLDVQEMDAFKKHLGQLMQTAQEKSEARAAQQLRWFDSERLVLAFDVFDPQHLPSNYEFALHSAICTIGLGGCKSGEAKIDAWLQADTVEKKNLYLRGLFYNRTDLMEEIKAVNAAVRKEVGPLESASELSSSTVIKFSKGLVDGFKKVDSAFDEWARNQDKQDFSKNWSKGLEVKLYHKASDITRLIFRKGVGGEFDKFLTAKLSVWLYARLGDVTEKLAYSDAMLSLPKAQVEEMKRKRSQRRAEARAEAGRSKKAERLARLEAEKIDDSLQDLIADARNKAKQKLPLEEIKARGSSNQPTNNYHQARIGVLLGAIEMIALGDKLRHFELGMRSALELLGSAMAVSSIVLDIYYAAAKSIREIAPYSKIAAIKEGADIVRGGFKLSAGVFSFGAGGISSYFDITKGIDEKDFTLQSIYLVRGAVGGASASMGLIAAYSYCESLFIHLSKRHAKSSLAFRFLANNATRALAWSSRVRLLVWIARLNMIGLALTAAEIGYILLKDDDLQNWCEECVFRKLKKSKDWLGNPTTNDNYGGNLQKELEDLEKAAQTVGAATRTRK